MIFLAIVERDYDEPMLFWKLESNTKEDAIKEFEAKMIGVWVDDDEYIGYDGGQIQEPYDLKRVLKTTLYEVNAEYDMPLEKWFSDAQRRTKEAKVVKNNDNEKMEYERLKIKFEGNKQ